MILLAVLAALAQLLLPLLARQPAWVAAQLGEQLQRPVSFASMEGRWTPSGPLFVLRAVTVGPAVGDKGAALQVPEAELKLDFGGWLLPSRHLLNLHLRGLQLDLTHAADGRWQVNGIGVAGGAERQSVSMGHLSLELWFEQLRVVIADARLGKTFTLLAPQLRLSRQGSEIRFGGLLRRDGVAAELRTAGRFQEDGSAGTLWLGVDDVELKPLLAGIDLNGFAAEGRGRLAAWLDWRQGRPSSSLIRLDLDQLVLNGPGGASASVAALHGLLGVRRTVDGYDLRWSGNDGSALALSLHQPGTPQLRVGVAARDLQLAPLLPWLALKPDMSSTLARWLGAGHPRGDLSRVALRWSRADGLQALQVAFEGLGIDPVGKFPGVSNLHGEVLGDTEAVTLELPAQATTLAFPQLFRQPLVMSRLAGTLAFWSQDGDWHLGADTLDFAGAGYGGQARGEMILPAAGGAPFLDLYANVDHAEVVAAKLFWPINAMSAGTVAWLDRALVAGQVDQAQVLLRGDLKDWPFRHNEGRFEARAAISDLTLDYGGSWPRAEGVAAVASFVDNGMLVEAGGGHSLGVKADRAVALIPDFGDPLLDLNVQGSGNGTGLMEFVRKSPIGIRQADTLAKLKLGGSGTFAFHLVLPLKKVEDARLDGTAQLSHADLSAPEWKLQLQGLTGPLRFDLHGMQAGPLSADFHGQPSTLQLAVAGANSDPATLLSAQLQGSYRMDELLQDFPSLNWLGQLADGRSDFTIGFVIARPEGSATLSQTLSVDSPLDGIALDLPAPLDKSAANRLPLHLGMTLPVSGSDLQFGLGQLMRGHLRLPASAQQVLAGTLAFGSQMPQDLPSHDLRIRGHAGQLDVTGWVQRGVATSGSGDGPGLESVNVSADQADWFGHMLGAMKLKVAPQPDRLSVDVDGPAMAGHFTVPTRDLQKRGITAQLQRLYWPATAETPAASPATRPAGPVVSAAAAASVIAPASAIAPVNPYNTGVNPAALPPMHLWVGDLRLGDAKLGEARMESWPTAHGMHIEQLRALSPRVQISANGDWNGSAVDSRTHMRIGFSAEDLGAMLGAFGYQGLVTGGKTTDQLDASWPGAPSALALASMDGTLSIRVSDGRIPEAASPGMGRLLGLVSLSELPRRLTLDFGDVFGKGLGFDSIVGDFHLADGNATTDNLVIKGPAAMISITGRTGLRARDYDQQVLVIPHVGNSLPLVGAVVGGPIGAAAGLAVQGLLGKGLNKAASARYHVTGTWEKPVFTEVEKPGGAVPLAAPAGPSSTAAPAVSGSVAPATAGSTVH